MRGAFVSAYSTRYEQALTMAARVHRTQLRKGTDTPYIVHVVHVATLLMRYGYNEDVVLAGLLHDVLEDGPRQPDMPERAALQAEIAARFGPEVERLVVAVSKPPDDVSWEAARATLITQLEQGGPLVAALKAADTLHNIRGIIAALEQDGDASWGRFKRGPESLLIYYRNVLQAVQYWIAWHPICHELAAALDELLNVYTES